MPTSDAKTAVVTGSAGTLGRAFAVRLAREGRRLALVDVNEPGNLETLRPWKPPAVRRPCETCDVRDAAAWQRLHDRLRARWPQLDLLVNNAGRRRGRAPSASFRSTIGNGCSTSNLRSVVLGCHTFAGWLRENPAGSQVINVASFGGLRGAAEHGGVQRRQGRRLRAFGNVTHRVAAAGVGVTVVCPGFFPSGLVTAARMMTDEQRDFTQRAMDEAGFTADDVAPPHCTAAERGRMYVCCRGKRACFGASNVGSRVCTSA